MRFLAFLDFVERFFQSSYQWNRGRPNSRVFRATDFQGNPLRRLFLSSILRTVKDIGGSLAEKRKLRMEKDLLQSHLCTCFFQLLLHFFGFCCWDGFLNNLRCSVDHCLCFAKSKSGNCAYNLDHSDFLVA